MGYGKSCESECVFGFFKFPGQTGWVGLFQFGLARVPHLYYYASHIISACAVGHGDVTFGYPLVHHFFNNERGLPWRLRPLHWRRFLFLYSQWIIPVRTFGVLHCLCLFQGLWALFTSRAHKFGCLFICKTIPNAVAGNYDEIVFGFDRHFFDVRERRYLMFFALLDVPVRSLLFFLLRCRLTGICSLAYLFLCFFHYLILKCGVLVLPISNSPWYCDYALHATVIYKAARCPNSLHLALVIWLMIMTQLCHFSIFADEYCSGISWIWAIDMILGHQTYASCAPCIKWYRLDLLFLNFV